MKRPALKILLFLALFLGGCDNYPKDTEGTLNRIQGTDLIKIGVIRHEPWAMEKEGRAEGLEPTIAEQFADTLKAKPEWHFLSEAEAVEQLTKHDLDMVIGGLTRASPRKKEVAFTRPYLKTGEKKEDQHVMALARGENRLMVTLETFLKEHKEDIRTLYRQRPDRRGPS